MESPAGSRDGDAQPSGGSGSAASSAATAAGGETSGGGAAGNGALPADPKHIAAVLQGLAAEREAAASGAATGLDELAGADAMGQDQPADAERLRSAAEAAMQRGDRVFAFPTGAVCLSGLQVYLPAGQSSHW